MCKATACVGYHSSWPGKIAVVSSQLAPDGSGLLNFSGDSGADLRPINNVCFSYCNMRRTSPECAFFFGFPFAAHDFVQYV